jgi:hypothetical protein
MSDPEAGFEFHWIHDKNFRFKSGIPTLSDGGSELWLAGHVYFDIPLHDEKADEKAVKEPLLLKFPCQKIGISWIMNNYNPRSTGSSMFGKNLRSVHFRGSTTRLSMPNHCVDYFMWLFQDVQQSWDQFFSNSESYLDRTVG